MLMSRTKKSDSKAPATWGLEGLKLEVSQGGNNSAR